MVKMEAETGLFIQMIFSYFMSFQRVREKKPYFNTA